MDIQKISITEASVGMRVDRWLKENQPIPFSLVQKFIRQKKIRVNGSRTEASYRLREHDVVEIKAHISEPAFTQSSISPALYKALLEQVLNCIVFMDDQIIAINKPFGVAVQGGNKVKISIDDVLDGLKYDFEEKPRLVHRLDQHTTGLLLLARTRKIAQELGVCFKSKLITKKYLAVLSGLPRPDQGTIKSFIAKTKRQGVEIMAEVANGKEAITKYRVIQELSQDLSLVEFIPVTGRTHQIRIHAATNLNTPVLGDAKYGWKSSLKAKNLHLHASEMSIKSLDGKSYHLKADLPEHIVKTINKPRSEATD